MAVDRIYPSVWGYVKQEVSAHDFTDTYFNPNMTQDDGGGVEYRSLWSFDTSSIPSNAIISAAMFTVRVANATEPVGYDGDYKVRLHYDADVIGASIDLGDFGFPDADIWYSKTFGSLPSPQDWVEFPSGDLDCINKDGNTDVEMRCISAFVEPPGAVLWLWQTLRPVGWRCYLDVTYTLEVLGTGTATGVGEAAGAGTLWLTGTATATGVGEATGAAVLEVPGAATVVGVGEATGAAVLELPSSATVKGVGEATGDATLWLSGVATAIGVGTAAAAGTVLGNIAHWGEPLEGYTGGPRHEPY